MDLNKETIKKSICTYLRQGMFKKDAAIMAGISEKTLYRWVEEDDSFDSQVEANILKYKQSLIKVMTQQAKKNGMLALKILQARWPKESNHSQDEDFNERRTVEPIVVSYIKPRFPQPYNPEIQEDSNQNNLYVSDV